MTEDKKTKEETSVEPVFELVNVPTQHTIAIQTPSGEVISTEQGIVMLLNEVKEIRKLVG